MKKWYLSTPMNGRTEEEIQAALERGKTWVKRRDEQFHSPYQPQLAQFDEENRIADHKPIAMLSKAIEAMDACTGVLYIGSLSDLLSSRGCLSEIDIARHYGKEVLFID